MELDVGKSSGQNIEAIIICDMHQPQKYNNCLVCKS